MPRKIKLDYRLEGEALVNYLTNNKGMITRDVGFELLMGYPDQSNSGGNREQLGTGFEEYPLNLSKYPHLGKQGY